MQDGELFVLLMNPIGRSTDVRVTVAVSRSKVDLENFVAGERVETYSEDEYHPELGRNHTFYKVFRKGGPLEMYNVPDEHSYAPTLSLKEALAREERQYMSWFSKLIRVGDLAFEGESHGDTEDKQIDG